MLIDRKKCLGLIIDIQEKLLPHIADHEKIQERTIKLIRGLRTLDVPMIVTQQYTKGLGPTVPDLQSQFSEFEFIEKTSFSCCGAANFNTAIQKHNKSYILISGVESHVCVQQTALELESKGYQPVVIADCIGSRNSYDKNVALERMRDAGCIITTGESILFELCKIAGTNEFKAISKIVK